jgi:hypothetical protein
VNTGSTIGLTFTADRSISAAIMIPGRMVTQSDRATKSSVPSIASSSNTRSHLNPFAAR